VSNRHEACVGAPHLSRKLRMLGHDARLMPAKYMRPYSKGQKNDFRDAEAIAEAVQRPTRKFIAPKTAEHLDLHAPHRVRERFVSQRAGTINQIRAFLLERGVAVYHAFSPRPAMPCRLACCASSKTWQGTGAGLMSASRVYRVRSRFLCAGMPAVSA
jgi:transposase